MADIHYAPLAGTLGAIHIHGPDAEKFLQGQFSNDLLRLPTGAGQWSSYSTAKGRMIANFFLQREHSGFYLFLAADLAEDVSQRLRKFRLMAKAEIEVCAEPVWGIWGADLRMEEVQTGPVGEDALSSILAALPWTEPAALLLAQDSQRLQQTGARECSANDWWAEAIRAGTAFITRATSEQIIPQELNLEVLGGINFKKGCYPGQEIVARSHYLGALKRQCYLLFGPAGMHAGQEIFAPSMGAQAVGVLINVAKEDAASIALAVLRAANDQEPLHLGQPDGPLLQLGTLPYPLPLSQQEK
ncbi:folate-binding protein [Acidithiobacillus sp. AMEEHan]|uniref:CAF17-like 4Fe-4S cluster assembly/insertion protein YgfZ n=1 Tax=Acidithiobacillus sp. AMEEHan TaxID=2994951 RepID=UPI0027E51FD5|nr:folate-binding protein [Acidithiobacillus sp. AMEEHan]